MEHGAVACTGPHGNFSFGSSCEFTCADGYTLSGSSSLQCTTLGQWSEEHPQCEAVRCEELRVIEHGVVACTGPHSNFSYSSSCGYTCAEGYKLKGSSSLQCTTLGQWSEEPPKCEVVTCGPLQALAHGFLNCSHPVADFSYTSSCQFSCEEGYALDSSDSVQCTSEGSWTAAVPQCEVVQCETLEDPAHGVMDCANPHGDFMYNSTCNFHCEEGFVTKGSEQLRCGAYGEWDGSRPQCEAVACTAMDRPEHGVMDCTHSSGLFAFQTSCFFSCEQGFVLMGASTMQCSSNRQWTAPAPTCQAVQCQALTEADEGVIVNCSHPFGAFQYGTECKYACAEERTLNGSHAVECSASGLWTSPPPTCEAPEDSDVYVAVGLAATGASVLSMASLLIWLVKRLRRTAKKFRPSSSCESLESSGIYQSIGGHV